jgi:hypothetical protein
MNLMKKAGANAKILAGVSIGVKRIYSGIAQNLQPLFISLRIKEINRKRY